MSMYVCMYLRRYVCVHVRMYVWMYVCMYVCLCVCMSLCMCACMHALALNPHETTIGRITRLSKLGYHKGLLKGIYRVP